MIASVNELLFGYLSSFLPESLLTIVFTEERGGLWEVQLQVINSGDTKIMLAWAREEIPKKALAIVRCLDKYPGSISLVTQYSDGWVTVGGLFGGLDKGYGALPKKDILLKN
jgi:hypothetical protein